MPRRNRRKTKNKDDISGIAFVGFFFLGFLIGAYYGRWDIAPFAALAFGFIAMFFARLKYAK